MGYVPLAAAAGLLLLVGIGPEAEVGRGGVRRVVLVELERDIAERIDWVEGDLATWTPPPEKVMIAIKRFSFSRSAPRPRAPTAG